MCEAVSALSSPLAAGGTCRRVVTPAIDSFFSGKARRALEKGEESAKRKETEGGPMG